MNQMQTFLLTLALIVAGVVLLLLDQTEAGAAALGAAIGALAPTRLTKGEGD